MIQINVHIENDTNIFKYWSHSGGDIPVEQCGRSEWDDQCGSAKEDGNSWNKTEMEFNIFFNL